MANNYIGPQTAESVAIVFLATALGLVLGTAAPHRRFYARYFAKSGHLGLSFYSYATSVVILTCGGSIVVLSAIAWLTSNWLLAVVGVLYYVSEKLADEILRLRLFEADFVGWGRINITRSVCQTLPVALVVAVPAWGVPEVAVGALATGSFLVLLPTVPGGLGGQLSRVGFSTCAWLIARAARLLLSDARLWLIVVLGALVGYLDRIVAVFVEPTMLPLFTLVVMCFSILQMTVDFFYVSRYRREFLDGRLSVAEAFRSKAFVTTLVGGLILACVACAAVLLSSRGGDAFPFEYVLAIAGLQTAVGVAVIPREILFWSDRFSRILFFELVFWIAVLFVVVAGMVFAWSTVWLFGLVVSCSFMRLLVYTSGAARALPRGVHRGIDG